MNFTWCQFCPSCKHKFQRPAWFVCWMWLVHLSEDLWQQPQVLECSEMCLARGLCEAGRWSQKKMHLSCNLNLLGPRPIRPISGLRIQDSVQLLQEQLHDSMIFYEPCFAKTRANPHVYVCMFVRNIYIYNPLLYITYKFDKCMTTYDSTKKGCKSTSVVIAFGFNGSRVVGRSNAVFCACAKHFYTQNLLIKNCPYTPHLCQAIQDHWFTTTSWSHYHSGVPWQHEGLLGEKSNHARYYK